MRGVIFLLKITQWVVKRFGVSLEVSILDSFDRLIAKGPYQPEWDNKGAYKRGALSGMNGRQSSLHIHLVGMMVVAMITGGIFSWIASTRSDDLEWPITEIYRSTDLLVKDGLELSLLYYRPA